MPRLERRDRYIELRRVGLVIRITRGFLDDSSPPTTETRRASWSRGAASELEELIREHVEHGWVLRPTEVSADGLVDERSPFEAALIADPTPETWAVQGDWLAARGDVRAELIALTLAREGAEPDRADLLGRTYYERLASHQRRWFPGLVELAEAGHLRWRWSHGYLRELWLGSAPGNLNLDHHGPRDLADVLDELLGHPTARLLEHLWVGELQPHGRRDAARVIGSLVAAGLPGLRRLEFGSPARRTKPSYLRIGNLARLEDLPSLRSLRVHGELVGLPSLPELEQLELEPPRVDEAWLDQLGQGAWPNLRRLWLTSELLDPWARLSIAIVPVLARRLASGCLRELGVQGTTAVQALVQLERLDLDELRLRSLAEHDAELLLGRHASLAGVGRLVLVHHRLDRGLDRLRARFRDRVYVVRTAFEPVE